MRLPFPAPDTILDAATEAGGKPLGDLPDWDLTDLYTAPDAPELARDLDWLDTECAAFAADYEGKLADLPAADLLTCIERHEKIDMIAGRIMSFAGLRYYQQTTNPERAKFMSDMQDKITTMTTPLVFFSLEFNRIDDDRYAAAMAENADLARYKPVLDRMRAMKPHQLSDELERYLHDTSVVGDTAWNKLFDETIAGLTFDIDGETLGIEATLNLLTDHDRASARQARAPLPRRSAHACRSLRGSTTRSPRKRKSPIAGASCPRRRPGRHLANHVEPEVVEALRNAVVAAYPRLSHRYYALKAKWLGLDTLQVWDRNAPLPMEDTALVPWDKARAMVTDAYAGFDPRMADLAEPFFTDGWIDAGVKEGKAPGAFAHPTVTDVHPYVMLNYLGKPRDVMTLAHELGHGVHQRLAAGQGEFLSSTPLTLAETASVFGEMLTFRKMLSEADTDAQRKVLLGGQGGGHDQHGRPPDRVLRFRVQAPRRAPRGRTDARRHQRAVDERAGRKPRARVRVHAGLRDLLGLHPAFRAFALLRLRLRLRRRARERALRGLRGRRRGLPGEVFRHAQGRRLQAPQGSSGALRSRCQRPGLLGQGPWHDRGLHRPARSAGGLIPAQTALGRYATLQTVHRAATGTAVYSIVAVSELFPIVEPQLCSLRVCWMRPPKHVFGEGTMDGSTIVIPSATRPSGLMREDALFRIVYYGEALRAITEHVNDTLISGACGPMIEMLEMLRQNVRARHVRPRGIHVMSECSAAARRRTFGGRRKLHPEFTPTSP
jgi:oligoendopeptidase F